MHRRTLICLTLLTLFLFSSLSLMTPFSGTTLPVLAEEKYDYTGADFTSSPTSLPPLPEGPTWDGTEYYYGGLGQVLTTQEYSQGDKSSAISNLLFNTPAYRGIGLPAGWSANQIDTSVYNLLDNITHIDGNTVGNGNFELGSTSPTGWSYDYDLGSVGSNGSSLSHYYDWGSSFGRTGNGISVSVDYWTSFIWNTSMFIGWEQDLTLERANLAWAKLTLDVRSFEFGSHSDYDEIAVYVEIEGHSYRYLCYDYCPVGTGWGSVTVLIPLDHLSDWSSSTINVKVGLGMITNWPVSSGIWQLDIDNVKLWVKGQPKPSDSGLSLLVNSSSAWTAEVFGNGSISHSGTWGAYAADRSIYANFTTSSSRSQQVSFSYTLTLYIQRSKTTESQTGPEGSAFWVKQGSSVYWTTWFFADFYSIYYENYNFTIQKPGTETWTLSSAIDPNLQDQTGSVTEDGTSVSLTSAAVTAFGWWNFTFSSTNRITSITGLAASYDIGDTLNIDVNHNTVTSGQCNITIYETNTTRIVHNESKSLSGSTQVSFSKLFDTGDNFESGLYTICATYDNGATGAMTRAGFYSAQFKIIHNTALVIELGAASKTVIREPGTYFLTLTYDDLDKTDDPWVANTTGKVQINGTLNAQLIKFRAYGNVYQAEIDSMLLGVGNHLFTVTADEPYHDSASDSITLLVRDDAMLSSPQSPGLTIPYDETFTVEVFYNDSSTGTGITGATVTTDWPTFPTGTGNGTGWYEITFDTADQSEPGTYPVTITAERNFYTTRTVDLIIVVREISTTMDITSPGSEPWGEDIVVNFDLSVNDPDSSHDGFPITSSSFSVQLDGSPLTDGPDYSLSHLGGGQYELTLLYSSGKISTIKGYTLEITADPTNTIYGDSTGSANFNVRQLRTAIFYTPPQPVPYGGDVVIVLMYQVDDPASSIDGNGITGASSIVGSTLDAVGLIPADYNFAEDGGGQYTLTIYFSSGKISTIKAYLLALDIAAPLARYEDAERDITFDIRALFTQITYDPPEPTPWSDDVVITVYYTVNDPGSSQHGNGITGASSIAGTLLDSVVLAGGEYTFVDDGGGQYTLTILYSSGKINTIKATYSLELHVVSPMGRYEDSDRTIQFEVRSIATLISYTPAAPVPRGTDVVIVFTYTVNDPASGQHNNGITGVTSIAGSRLDGVLLTGPDYTLSDDGGGQYTLTILYSSGKINTIKATYSLDLNVVSPDPQHNDASQNIGFEVRRVRMAISYEAVGSTGWGLDVVINFEYIVDDSASGEDGDGLPGVTSIAGSLLDGGALNPSDYNLVDNGLGQYTLTILYSSGKISAVKLYSLDLHVVSPDAYHEDADQTIGFRIRNHYIASNIDPIASIPWGNEGTMTLRVDDDDLGSPLPDSALSWIEIIGPTTLIFNSGNWDNSWNGTADDGRWDISFDPGWAIGTYSSVIVNIYTSTSYENGTVNTGITVRALATRFTYDSPPDVPWGEHGILIVSYFVSDPGTTQHNSPITTGTNILISGLTNPADFTFVNNGDGTYTITFVNDTVLTTVGSYQFNITITSPSQYDNGQLNNVPLTVRELFTTLTYTQVPSVPFGDPVLIDVIYRVLDGQSTYHNGELIGSPATITVIGLDFALGGAYSYQWTGSVWRITIQESALSGIRSYSIQVDIISPAQTEFASAQITTLTFEVRTVESELIRSSAETTPYGETVTIFITYRVRDDFSSIDLAGINDSLTHIDVIGNGWTLNPSDWTAFFEENGVYRIEIDTAGTPGLGTWTLTISIDRPESPPTYREKSVQASLETIERPTRITFTRPGSTGSVANISLDLTYDDLTSGTNITGSVSIIVINTTSMLELTTPYWILPSSSPFYDFNILINASNLGAVGVFFDFRLDVSWTAGAPFYADSSDTFRVYIVGQQTELIGETTATTPSGDDMYLYVWYNATTDPPIGITNGSENVHILVLCDQIGGWDYSYWTVSPDPVRGGRYIITILGSKGLPSGVAFTFQVNASWTTNVFPYYENATQYVGGLYRDIFTSMTIQPLPDIYWGDNITLIVSYTDEDHGDIPVPSGDVTWFAPEFTGSWTAIWTGTQWEITFDTSAFSTGTGFFTLEATAANHASKDQRVDYQIKEVALDIVRIDPTGIGIIVNWGDSVYIQIYLNDTVHNLPVDDASAYYQWSNFTQLLMTSDSGGYYSITIDTGVRPAATYPLTLTAKKGNCSEPLMVFTLTVQRTDTNLDVYDGTFGTLTTIDVIEGSSFWVAINYSTIDGIPIEFATVEWTTPVTGIDGSFTYVDLGGGLGIFNVTFYTDQPTGWISQFGTEVQILVSASFPNAVTRTVSFRINLLYTPAAFSIILINGIEVNQSSTSEVSWGDNYQVAVFLENKLTGFGVPDLPTSVEFSFAGIRGFLAYNGTQGWYVGTVFANATASSISYPLEFISTPSGYQRAANATLILVEPRETNIELLELYAILERPEGDVIVQLDPTSPLWEIPYNDTLRMLVNFTDYLGNPRTALDHFASVNFQWYGRPAVSYYNATSQLWVIEVRITVSEVTDLMGLSFTVPNHIVDTITRTMYAMDIPLELGWSEETQAFLATQRGILYIQTSYTLTLELRDTYHNIGVVGLTPDFIIPTGILMECTDIGNGFYNLFIQGNTPISTIVTFVSSADFYRDAEFSAPIQIQFSDLQNTLIFGGAATAVILIVVLLGWILWARVYSVPWEVRRIRKLAKTVEKDETYSLSRKDLKHFHERGVVLEGKVDTAMAPIGVAVTSAMIPTTEELEEVTATEEDIMTELDKIPGLGPEEKAVLAEEMRKIPRKDRIWFLDDLRRQMGQRRMDFLTQKDEQPTPEAPPEPTPTEVPPPDEKAPALEEVKPKEPPPSKAMTEDRTAPTVLPPDLQPAPAGDPAVIAEVRRELSKIPGLSEEEKDALVDHLQYLSKEERQSTYRSLKMSAESDEK